MIWTFRVECIRGAYLTPPCIRVIEIDSGSSLIDLHDAIPDAVQFGRDHPCEFYVGRSYRNRQAVFHDSLDWDEAFNACFQAALDHVYPLPKSLRLSHHFDFGDRWCFKIRKVRKKPTAPEAGVHYPRVIEAQRPNPEQYPVHDWCS